MAIYDLTEVGVTQGYFWREIVGWSHWRSIVRATGYGAMPIGNRARLSLSISWRGKTMRGIILVPKELVHVPAGVSRWHLHDLAVSESRLYRAERNEPYEYLYVVTQVTLGGKPYSIYSAQPASMREELD